MLLLPRVADFRGNPKATTYPEARLIFRLAKLSKEDVFYDLGCGHGWVCIWAGRFCRAAKGIESHHHVAMHARKNVYHYVVKRGITNVEIIEDDFSRCRFPDADVLYCIGNLNVHQFEKWNRRRKKRNLRIVTLGPPPIPIKPIATRGAFCLTPFPYERAKSVSEWYQVVLGTKHVSWKKLRKKYKMLNDETLRSLKRDLKRYFGLVQPVPT